MIHYLLSSVSFDYTSRIYIEYKKLNTRSKDIINPIYIMPNLKINDADDENILNVLIDLFISLIKTEIDDPNQEDFIDENELHNISVNQFINQSINQLIPQLINQSGGSAYNDEKSIKQEFKKYLQHDLIHYHNDVVYKILYDVIFILNRDDESDLKKSKIQNLLNYKSHIYLFYDFKNNLDVKCYIYNHDHRTDYESDQLLYYFDANNNIEKADFQKFWIINTGNLQSRLSDNLFILFIILLNIYSQPKYNYITHLVLYDSNHDQIRRFNDKKFTVYSKLLKVKKWGNIFHNEEYNQIKSSNYSHIIKLLLIYPEAKKLFLEFINKHIKEVPIVPIKKKEKISIHYQLSDFCAGNTDNEIQDLYNKFKTPTPTITDSKCFNIKSTGDDGLSLNIVSFIYYEKIIKEIIKDKDINNFVIIIYYLKTNIDDIIIKLFIKYLILKFPGIAITTEYEYYEQPYNELDLLYSASLNNYIIMTNSTFSYWMFFFKILYLSELIDIDCIYFSKHLKYLEHTFLDLNGDLEPFISDKLISFKEECHIKQVEYFYCLKNDIIRIFLVLLYFKLNKDLDMNELNATPDCKWFIQLYKKYYEHKLLNPNTKLVYEDIEDIESIFELYDSTPIDITKDKLTQIFKKIVDYNIATDTTDTKLTEIISLMSFNVGESSMSFSVSESLSSKNKYFKYKTKYLKLKNKIFIN